MARKAVIKAPKSLDQSEVGLTQVDLDTKMQPPRGRARDTFEMILATTGELLCDVGFERLSTNMICTRAGITPPALYRYFPNKYAIMKELGQRLMQAQDDVVFQWIEGGGLDGTLQEQTAQNLWMYRRVIEVTREMPGGLFISRVMRVIPILREVRVGSSELVASRLQQALRTRHPKISEARLRTAARLSTEMGYATIEIALEEPGIADDILAEAARMVVGYFDGLEMT